MVLGNTPEGHWTILRAFYVSSSDHEVLLAGSALLVGIHLKNQNDSFIHKSLLRFTHLEEWAGQPLVRDEAGSSEGYFKLVVPTAAKSVFRVEGPSQFKSLTLWNGLRISRKRTETSLTSQSHFVLDFNPPTNLIAVNQMIRALANLLALLVGEAVLPRKVRLVSREPGTDQERTVDCFVPSQSTPQGGKSEYEMPFPLRDFDQIDKDVAAKLFKEWFLKEDVLRPVCDLLLSTIYYPGQYVQSTFLSLAQALESFHRRTRPGTYVRKDAYDEIRKALLSAIPTDTLPDLRQKLQSTLAFANELSLKTRMKQLFEEVDPEHAADLA